MSEWNAATAEWYVQNFGEYPTNREGVRRIEFPAEAVVLDIGCGSGSALRTVGALVPGATLIGVDPVPRMLELAREQGGEALDLRLGDAGALPVPDHRCDVVLAFDSMDHWSDVDAGLREVHRVLKPGALFVVVKDLSAPGGLDTATVLRGAGFGDIVEETVDLPEVRFVLWRARARD